MNYEHFFEIPIVLEDERARLEPLEEKHFELLLPTAMQTMIWEFTMAKIYTAADFKKFQSHFVYAGHVCDNSFIINGTCGK